MSLFHDYSLRWKRQQLILKNNGKHDATINFASIVAIVDLETLILKKD